MNSTKRGLTTPEAIYALNESVTSLQMRLALIEADASAFRLEKQHGCMDCANRLLETAVRLKDKEAEDYKSLSNRVALLEATVQELKQDLYEADEENKAKENFEMLSVK